MSLPPTLSIIDVETTGANPVVDRVTEIGILRIEGGQLVESWSSLVNPGVPIPAMIQRFTGISDEMVRDAPTFGQIADGVRTLLQDGVFVAHNARFDYGFIKNEFRRIGQDFDAEVLCTVKLSRALYPEHHRHGLDALIARHDLHCAARHRALGDAQVLWDFLQKTGASFAESTLEDAVGRAMKRPSRPPGLPEGVLEGIPAGPGVYLLFGERNATDDLPLYIGKSVNMRSRVGAHFAADHRHGKEAQLAQQVRAVEFIATAGELGALLLESQLVKSRQPLHNRKLRRDSEVRGLRFLANRRKPPVLASEKLDGRDPADWAEVVFGTFRGKREIDNALRELASLYRLCPCRLGLEPNAEGPCMAYQLKRCAGVCAGRESPAQHDGRLASALNSLRLKAWPWPGPIAIREFNADSERTALHVVDRWCLLGSVENEDALAELLSPPPPRAFDLDTYRIISRWLSDPAHLEAIRVLSA